MEWQQVFEEATSRAGVSDNFYIHLGVEHPDGSGTFWLGPEEKGKACEVEYDRSTLRLSMLVTQHTPVDLLSVGELTVNIGDPTSLDRLGTFLNRLVGIKDFRP